MGSKTKAQLLEELDQLKVRVAELEGARSADAGAGKALQESELKFRSLIEQATDTIILMDGETNIVDVNQMACQSLGYSRRALLKLNATDLNPQLEPQEHIERYLKPLQPGEPITVETQHQHKDGHIFPVELRLGVVDIAEERLYLAIARDITEREQAKEKLRESEEKFSQLFQTSPNVLMISTLNEGKIIDVNDIGIQAIGLPKEKILNKTSLELGLVDAEMRAQLLNAIQEQGYYTAVELPVILPNGGQRFGLFYGQAITFGDQRYLFQTIVDITERKQTEDVLRESEARNQLILQSLPMAFYRAVPYGEFGGTWCSEQIDQIAGFSPEDMVEPDFWASRLHPVDWERTLRAFEDLVENESLEIEYRWQRADGEYIWIQDNAVMLKDDLGDPQEIIGTWTDISERKIAELELRASEERYRSLVENLPLPFLIHSDEKVVYANPVCAIVLGGTSPEEFLGKSIWDFVPPGYKEFYSKRLDVTYGQRQPAGIEDGKLMRLSGDVIDIEILGAPIEYKGQEAVQSIFVDITERKQAEMAIRESEEKFHKVFMASPYSLMITRMADEVIIDVNEWFEKHIGYSREDVIGHTAIDLNLVKDPKVLEKLSRIVAVEGGARDLEMSVIGKDGQETISIVSSALIELQGEPHRITIGKDVTDLKESEQALIESELRYRTLFENASDAIFILKGDRIIDCNNVVQSMFGYSKGEIIGKHPGEISPRMQPDGRESISKAEAMIRKASEGFPQLFEWEHQRKDGSEFTAEVNLHQVVIQDEILTQAVVRDLTERKEAEQVAFEERQRLARDLHDAVSQTLWSASLIADVLPDVWQQDPSKGLERLDRLRQLTRGALAEMRALLLELRPHALIETKLTELLSRLVEATKSRSGAQISLVHDDDCDFPEDVHVTLFRIAQEALNNATRHAIASEIEVRLQCGSKYARLEIVDNGTGFDPEGTPSGQHLGLKIMRERALSIGANLDIISRSDDGTQVVLIWRGGSEVNDG